MKDKMVAAKADFRELLKVIVYLVIMYHFAVMILICLLNLFVGEQIYFLQVNEEHSRIRPSTQGH